MDYQLLLNDSYAAHKRLDEAIQRLYSRFSDEAIEANRLTPKRFLAIFDLKLEYELLKSALEAVAKKGSLAYLRAMSAFCFDILGFGIKYCAYRGFEIRCDYDSVLNLPPEEQARLLSLLDNGLAPLWEKALALIQDFGYDEGFLEILEKETFRLGDVFLMADDRNSDVAIRLLQERIRCAILDPIAATEK